MKTVKKAVEVLNCFSHQEPELSVGELSRRLGVHKSIISRLVAALRSKRMLDQKPGNQEDFNRGRRFPTRRSILLNDFRLNKRPRLI